MALTLSPLSSIAPLDLSFGRVASLSGEASGSADALISDDVFDQIERALYTHGVLVFPKTNLSPALQYALTRRFDPESTSYGHGNTRQAASILHPDLKTIPSQPQVQVIGNGHLAEYQGLRDITLKHPHHKTFHQTRISDEEDHQVTRFYRWHIDSALYDLATPRVTTLYAVSVPQGERQTLRYDDGSGETMDVPLGTTAFVSGHAMFERLTAEEKSLVVRSRVRYAPHPYVWMSKASSNSVGLGLVSEDKELPLHALPAWEETKIKTLPMAWKNPVTGALHLQIHPSAVQEILIEPASPGSQYGTLFPQGAHLTNLEEVRALVYSLQRPAVAPQKVYAHDWKEGDLCIFHNQGVLHSVVGAFREDQVRVFHQCNLASSADPLGPSEEDVKMYA